MRVAGRSWLLLGALFGGLVLVAGIWVSLDRRPPAWDHANHLERALVCWQILSERGWAGLGPIMKMSAFYPPVVPCAAGLLYFLLPITPLTAQLAMLAFLGLGLVSLFLLGCWLFDARTGLLAALMFGTAPFVVYSTTNFQLDLPLAAVTIFALLALIRTEGFARPGWAVATGVAFALGMLVKPPFAIFLLPPLGVVAWRVLRAPGRRRRLATLALAVVLGAALSLPWYGPRLFGLPLQVANRAFKQAAQSGHPQAFSPSSLLFYPKALLPIFGLLAGLLFVWGLIALARRPGVGAVLWGASVVPFGVVLLGQNRNLRYVLPLLPVAALIAAAGVGALPPGWRRRTIVVVGVLAALQVGAAAFGVPPVPRWTPFDLPLVFSSPPSSQEWRHPEILAILTREARGAPATVSVVPNFAFFSVSNFRYYAARDKLPFRMARAWDEYPLGLEFIVLKTGSQGPEFSVAKPKRIMAGLAGGDPAFEQAFPVIWEAPLPDGSMAIVRQRRLSPVKGVPAPSLAAHFKAAVTRFIEPYARDVEGLTVELSYASQALLKGEVREVRVGARSARIAEFARKGAELRVQDAQFALEGVVFNPYRLVASGEIEPLDLKRLRVEHLVVTEQDLQAFVRGLRRFSGLKLSLGKDVVVVALAQPGPDVGGRLKVVAGRGTGPLTIRAEQVSLGGILLPPLLVDWVFRHYDPAPRLAGLPTAVDLGQIRIEPGRIVVLGGVAANGEPER